METINVSKMITEFKNIEKEFEYRLHNGDISSYVSLTSETKCKTDAELLEVFDIIPLRSNYFYSKINCNNRVDAETYFSQEKIFVGKKGVTFESKYYKTVFYNIAVVSPLYVHPHYSLKILLDDVNNKDGFIFTHDESSEITIQCDGVDEGTSFQISTKQPGCTFTLFSTMKSYYTVATHILSRGTIDKLYYKPKTE